MPGHDLRAILVGQLIAMPVTPFHLGPALLVKATTPRWFSLLSFSVTQCIIDIETMSNIVLGNYPLHATAHTIHIGALIGACAGVATGLLGWLLGRRGPNDQFLGIASEFAMAPAIVGGIVGGASHAVLDAIMHPDAGPFRPFDPSNPFLGLVSVWVLHAICLVCGLVGMALVRTVDGVTLAKTLALFGSDAGADQNR